LLQQGQIKFSVSYHTIWRAQKDEVLQVAQCNVT
jgi:hypothetical protein